VGRGNPIADAANAFASAARAVGQLQRNGVEKQKRETFRSLVYSLRIAERRLAGVENVLAMAQRFAEDIGVRMEAVERAVDDLRIARLRGEREDGG